MTRYVLQRMVGALVALWLVLSLVFIALQFSGDPVRLLLDPSAPESVVEAFREELGYNDPFLLQYGRFFTQAFTLDFGDSLRFRQPAAEVVLSRIWPTAQLALSAIALSLVIAFITGYFGAQTKRTWVRGALTWPVSVMQAVPTYFLGVVLILIFSLNLGWFPTGGSGSPAHLVLPVVTLALSLVPSVSRVLRTNTVTVSQNDFVRTTTAKGLTPTSIAVKHIIPNASLPVLTIIGLELGTVLGGSIVLEKVFSWPGLGQLMIDSITNNDYPVVLASVAFLTMVFVMLNLAVDLLYGIIDPRIRLAGKRAA